MTEQVKRLMTTLGISEEEAQDILNADKFVVSKAAIAKIEEVFA